MKANRTVFSLLIALFLMNSTVMYSQFAMLKGAVMLIPEPSYGVADAGIEFKVSKSISLEASYSVRMYGNYDGFYKDVLSFQSRYYFKGKRWNQSPFVGLVVQKFNRNDGAETYIERDDLRYETYETHKQALGVILGHHFKIYKRLGLDIHGGFVRQKGDETYRLYNANSLQPKEFLYKKDVVGTRPFAGLNLYFAIGKMPPKVEKNKGERKKSRDE